MILILGGAGLVGSGFARHCASAGLPHTVITRDNYLQSRGLSCDLLINANGNSRKPLARQSPLEDFDASVRSVRASLLDFPCSLYVHISSCDVYPDCSSAALTREDLPLDPVRQSPYGFHKYLAELCVQHAAPRWLIARCGGFIGPGLKKNAIFDVLGGGPLWLDPASRLQFLHTDAAAAAILRLAASAPANQIYNVCGRGTIAIQEVIDALGAPVPVQPASPAVHYEVNIHKALALVNLPDTRAAVLDFVRSQAAPFHE